MLNGILPWLDESTVLMQQSGGDAGAAGGLMTIIYLALVVVVIAGIWKVFTKAGQPGWAAIIPIYNIIVWLRVIERPWWWLLLILFVPIVNIIILIIMDNDLSKAFGHGIGFTLGLIFLPFIFLPILGFGGSQYVGRTGGAAQTAAAPA